MLTRYSEAEKLAFLRTDRRTLHRIPETRYELPKTRAYILSVLEPLKPDTLVEIAGGVKCVFRAAKPELGAIALRADMDALNVVEENPIDWASIHEGKMHACGHDGHMASLLLTAREIANNRQELRRDVTLIFQPAEEGCGGAQALIDAGILHDPEITEVLGMHVWPDYPAGKLAVKKGPLMASIALVNITFNGRSAHGATPHKGCDALLAACRFTEAVYSALRMETDPFDPTVFSIGLLNAGTASNVVAAKAELSGTIRAYTETAEKQVLAVIERCVRAAALANGCTGEVKILSRHGAVVNHPEHSEKIRKIMGSRAVEAAPVLISEDFSAYQKKVPGTFFFAGCGDGEHTAALHTCRFLFDESALLPAEEVFVKAVFDDIGEEK